MSLRRIKGFTLLELMVTVAVVAILAGIAFPSFESTIRSSRVAAAHNELIGLLNLARSEAIRSGRGGGVCASTDGATCSGSWGSGALAYADTNGDGSKGASEVALRFVTSNDKLVVTGPDAGISFDGRGRRRASTDQQITMKPSTCSPNVQQQRVFTVNASGQVSSVKEEC
ncbi:GspH/FimT family pseudopilin [Stenotrophomonas sp. WHRI 8082]|uniref:GspH/FimT family pseudopilin n=1 Tax=Stenotrophomonas sp. WHRI 8082 TaxID=3162571 RepID=UPI0032EF2B0F